jgi:3',5'-cyclic AMP phosphodiesterase CpdA
VTRTSTSQARLPAHTGDITHLTKPEEFDTAAEIIKGAGNEVHYVPGEHDWLDQGQGFRQRHGRGPGRRLVQLRQFGVHFIALVNVVNFKTGSLTSLGADQIAWLKDDVVASPPARPSSSSPISLWGRLSGLGLGRRTAPRRLPA